MFRYTVRFSEEEHNRFLSMFEKSGVYAKSVLDVYKRQGEHVVDVEVGLLHLDVTLCQFLAVVVTHILVEGVEPVSYTHL